MQIICYTMTTYLAAYLGNTGSAQEEEEGGPASCRYR